MSLTLLNVYGPRQRRFVGGSGCWLVDVDGRRYLDLLAGIAVVSLGHAHPAVTRALTSQAQRLWHTSNIFDSDVADAALRALDAPLAAIGDAKVFFANSGAEANEAALKLVRRARPGQSRIVALKGAFHGRTAGALSLTGQSSKRAPFEPLVPDIVHVDPNEPEALEAAVADPSTAAVIVEPILGEAGVRPLSAAAVAAIERGRARSGALLVVDEVQAGLGRTGFWLASEGVGLCPDAVTLAKALGNGYPVGAMVARVGVGDVLVPGDHGSTFGGNPLALAVVAAVARELVALDAPRQARERGALLATLLAEVEGVVQVEGAGLMLGAELAAPIAHRVVELALDEGVIANATGPTRLRLVPPLVIAEEEVRFGVARLARAIERALEEVG